jgi:putative peptidoglycan lipid II flippase
MTYSATIIQFPLGLIGTAVSIAILPTLSRQTGEGQSDEFRTTLAQGLRMVLALTVPAAIGLWVLATPIVKLFLEHGQFTVLHTAATVSALRFHLLGLVFAAVDQPLIFSFYARQDTWTPALVGVATVILYVVLALAPTLFVPLTLNGLILANSLKWAAHAIAMLYLLQRRAGGLGRHGVGTTLLTATLLSGLMGLTVHLIKLGMSTLIPPGTLGELLLVASAGIGGIVVYGGLALLVGMDEIRLLRRAFGA